jgi:RimJ/RimL family protein N-acetyltransferase
VEVLATTVRLRDGRDVVVRSPRASDAVPVLTYMRTLARQSYKFLGNPPEIYDAMSEEDEAAFCEMQLHHPRSFVVCAWSGEHVLGSAGLSSPPSKINEHTAELGLGVLEAARRIGLGRALTERVLAVGAANGMTNVHLRVRAFNEPAIRLYEALGFLRIGTLVGFARLPEGDFDEHVYQRISG